MCDCVQVLLFPSTIRVTTKGNRSRTRNSNKPKQISSFTPTDDDDDQKQLCVRLDATQHWMSEQMKFQQQQKNAKKEEKKRCAAIN